jgi:hypothetical protein
MTSRLLRHFPALKCLLDFHRPRFLNDFPAFETFPGFSSRLSRHFPVVAYHSSVGTDLKTIRKASAEERNLGTARLALTTNRNVEFASRASKREVTILWQGERRNTRQGDRAEQKRRDIEAATPTLIYCLVMLDLTSDKRRRSYTTQKVMRGLV